MSDVTPFPFAEVQDLKDRWPDMPAGSDAHALTLLEDASQFILDIVPSAATATPATRRRVVCAVVRRAMEASASEYTGLENIQATTGPFTFGGRPSNPHGDFYLTSQEKKALGSGRQRAFGVQVGGSSHTRHLPWCNLSWGADHCSCGADIAGEPIYELG